MPKSLKNVLEIVLSLQNYIRKHIKKVYQILNWQEGKLNSNKNSCKWWEGHRIFWVVRDPQVNGLYRDQTYNFGII